VIGSVVPIGRSAEWRSLIHGKILLVTVMYASARYLVAEGGQNTWLLLAGRVVVQGIVSVLPLLQQWVLLWALVI